MKKISVYLLIFLLSFVFTSESVQILASALGDDSCYAWMENMDGSESSTESENSKEQKEKAEFLGHFLSHFQLALDELDGSKLGPNQRVNLSSSDYSQTIYSPPEVLA